MFRDFIGNSELKSRLEAMTGAGTIAHAVLILGEDGCGRRAFAKALAAGYLNDTNGMVARGVHPDLICPAPSGAMNQITVETMRNALSELSRSAVTTDGRRVALIDRAECLNRSSAAALLKTLEEPHPGILFILTAGTESDVIDTVASRCAKYTLQPPSEAECAALCEQRTGAPIKECRRLSALFSGRVGLVLHYLRDGAAAESLKSAGSLVEHFSRRDLAGVMAEAAKPADRIAAGIFWQEVTLLLMQKQAEAPDELIPEAVSLIAEGRKKLDNNLNLRLFATELALQLGKAF